MKRKQRNDYQPTNDILAKMVLRKEKFVTKFIEATLEIDVKSVVINDGLSIYSVPYLAEETVDITDEVGNIISLHYTETDMTATLTDGTEVIIEVQILQQPSFLARLDLYRSARRISMFEELRAKNPSNAATYQKLRPIHTISILAENLFDDDFPFHKFANRDVFNGADTPYIETKDGKESLSAILELKKFTSEKLTGALKYWFQYWANDELDESADDIIKEADDMTQKAHLSKEEREMIDKRVILEENAKAYYWNAREMGMIEGRLEGRLEGKLEGKLEGRLEGKLEGRLEGILEGERKGILEGEQKKAIEFARNSFDLGLSDEQIVKLTGLSLSQVVSLHREAEGD